MMKKRINNWPTLLAKRMEELRGEPFAWGKNDCCLMASNLIEAITGIDPMKELRGTYSTQEEAEDLLASLGGIEAAAANIAEEYEWAEISIAIMGRGDLALIRHDVGLSLGICEGVGIAATAPGGMILLPRKMALKAWRVG